MEKVFVLVSRGLTDKTAVCVFPWEAPILEEIHGSNAVPVTIDEMCDLKSPIKVKQLKLKHATEKMPNLREQLEAMVKVDPLRNPLEDPEAEFARMEGCYGRHLEVNLPNVTKVYGSVGNFRRAMRDFAMGKTPDFLDQGGPIEIPGEKPVAEMTDGEIRAILRERKVTIPKGVEREELEELLTGPVTA